MSLFHFRINDGETETIEIESSYYNVAAAAILRQVTNDEMLAGVKIEVWVPHLLPDYGPYIYWANINQYANIEVGIMSKAL